jgi:hypothetical protein
MRCRIFSHLCYLSFRLGTANYVTLISVLDGDTIEVLHYSSVAPIESLEFCPRWIHVAGVIGWRSVQRSAAATVAAGRVMLSQAKRLFTKPI